MERRWIQACAAMAALGLPGAAVAHGFGRLYNLPVPFWLYAWGAASALLVSFLVVGVFMAVPDAARPADARDLGNTGWVRALRRVHAVALLKALALTALLLCIVTGFFGSSDPYRNFSMTAFWVLFVLAFTYLTALSGDLYAAINPWTTLAGLLERAWQGFARGRFRYPEALGDWPALGFYAAFVWLELFGHVRPFSLATVLTVYTVLNIMGVWSVGAAAWFRHCEFFAVFLRHVALLAPLDYRPAVSAGHGRLRWRGAFAALTTERPERVSTLLFVLFMLSSTAFDGLRVTQWWVSRFWHDPTGIVTTLAGAPPLKVFVALRPWYLAWESLWLLASPFVYLAVYLGFMALARAFARSERSVRELALDFAYTLLPIVFVYNLTHYFTLLLSQGPKIVSLLSDPFGWGWNLFGMTYLWRGPLVPELKFVWHAQVLLILLGHIVSVVLAHRVALRVFPTRGRAFLSQVPLLLLMVAFTVAGLWILAQPLTDIRATQ
jgi:hypothetical protein